MPDLDPSTPQQPAPLPDWFSEVKERFIQTGDPSALPLDEFAHSPELCHALFASKHDAIRAGLTIGESKASAEGG